MSYFDGIISEACRDCFSWDGHKWVQVDSWLCDECDYMLDMFPMIDSDKERQREKWQLLTTMEKPVWRLCDAYE